MDCPNCGRKMNIFGLNAHCPGCEVEIADKTTIDQRLKGRKDDTNKERWDLLPWAVIKKIVQVLTFGARKYTDNNWQKVENPRDRYFAAAQRHIADWRNGETNDPESGLPHLAHAACCLIFLMWFDEQS